MKLDSMESSFPAFQSGAFHGDSLLLLRRPLWQKNHKPAACKLGSRCRPRHVHPPGSGLDPKAPKGGVRGGRASGRIYPHNSRKPQFPRVDSLSFDPADQKMESRARDYLSALQRPRALPGEVPLRHSRNHSASFENPHTRS